MYENYLENYFLCYDDDGDEEQFRGNKKRNI